MLNSVRDSLSLSRRAVAIGSVMVMHAVIVYLFASGLGSRAIALVAPPIIGSVIDQPPTPALPPPLPPINLQRPIFKIVDPVIAVTPDDPTGGTAISIDPGPISGPVDRGPPQPAAPIRLIGRNVLPNSEDFYPPGLRRQNIEGATNVRVCVDAAGIRQGEPTVELSSGNPLLDQGAVNVARAGKYARAVQGDMPVPQCYRIRIGFRLK